MKKTLFGLIFSLSTSMAGCGVWYANPSPYYDSYYPQPYYQSGYSQPYYAPTIQASYNYYGGPPAVDYRKPDNWYPWGSIGKGVNVNSGRRDFNHRDNDRNKNNHKDNDHNKKSSKKKSNKR